jgi:hypothetical protein
VAEFERSSLCYRSSLSLQDFAFCAVRFVFEPDPFIENVATTSPRPQILSKDIAQRQICAAQQATFDHMCTA